MPEERVDVVDENGRKTGMTASRKDAHLKGLWHQTADVWIYNSKGEILLQKHSMEKESYPGLLDVSAAGHVSTGETPIQAALRELGEELGIKAHETDLKEFLVSKVNVSPKPGYYNKHVYHVYLLKHEELPKKLQNDEIDFVKFMPLSDFEREVTDKELLKSYVKHRYFPQLIAAVKKELKSVQEL